MDGDKKIYTTSGGNLRLWTKNQSTIRNTNSILQSGDFIPSDVDIPVSMLGSGVIDLYAEGVQPSPCLTLQNVNPLIVSVYDD